MVAPPLAPPRHLSNPPVPLTNLGGTLLTVYDAAVDHLYGCSQRVKHSCATARDLHGELAAQKLQEQKFDDEMSGSVAESLGTDTDVRRAVYTLACHRKELADSVVEHMHRVYAVEEETLQLLIHLHRSEVIVDDTRRAIGLGLDEVERVARDRQRRHNSDMTACKRNVDAIYRALRARVSAA